MLIELREANLENFDQVVNLKLPQGAKRNLASNVYSIAASKYFPQYQPKAIYCDSLVVGFLMYTSLANFQKPNNYLIFRFMIDYRHQRKGIGRLALLKAIEEIRHIENAEKVVVNYDPRNEIAKCFYKKLGFIEVGLDEHNEMLAEMIL